MSGNRKYIGKVQCVSRNSLTIQKDLCILGLRDSVSSLDKRVDLRGRHFTGYGQYRENPELIKKGIEWLTKHQG